MHNAQRCYAARQIKQITEFVYAFGYSKTHLLVNIDDNPTIFVVGITYRFALWIDTTI